MALSGPGSIPIDLSEMFGTILRLAFKIGSWMLVALIVLCGIAFILAHSRDRS